MTSHLGNRIQNGETSLPRPLDGLVRFLQESVGPGVVGVLVSESIEQLSCVCSPHDADGFRSSEIYPAAAEISPVPSCSLLSQGEWTVLCAAASVDGIGALAVQAEVSHFARQHFRYRRFCGRALRLGLISVINILELQRAFEPAHEREEQVRHLVHSNALARQEERELISLQLHDGVIQSMVSAFQMVEAVRDMGTQQAEQSAILQRAEEILSEAIRGLRGVINALHTAITRPETRD